MFTTMKTLLAGANARATEQLRDHYSIELIDQKIREAQTNLKAAKLGLASLIQRERSENRQVETLKTRIDDLSARARDALDGAREDLAQQAAQAIADMQNETNRRKETLLRLQTRILNLRESIETAQRRIIDLKQGAVSARALRREQGLQKGLQRHLGGESPMDEADALIARVLGGDDPFEQAEILQEIDRNLDPASVSDTLAAAGFGDAGRATAADVLANLKSKS